MLKKNTTIRELNKEELKSVSGGFGFGFGFGFNLGWVAKPGWQGARPGWYHGVYFGKRPGMGW